jgi:DNA-binding transcriptional regulator YiaG
MPNIASVLKGEIGRIARKEVRHETESLKKASAIYRSEIAALKQRVSALEKLMNKLNKRDAGEGRLEKDSTPPKGARFSTKGLVNMRKRLGLSAADFGKLIGVTAQSIYNWEAGKTRPREQQVTAIAALRGIGKRQVKARLENQM